MCTTKVYSSGNEDCSGHNSNIEGPQCHENLSTKSNLNSSLWLVFALRREIEEEHVDKGCSLFTLLSIQGVHAQLVYNQEKPIILEDKERQPITQKDRKLNHLFKMQQLKGRFVQANKYDFIRKWHSRCGFTPCSPHS